MQAPVNSPVTMPAISPVGAVRGGVFGSLSATSSSTASRVKMTAVGIEAMNANEPSSFSQPRRAAQAVAAGGVNDRRPAKIPMRKQRRRVMVQSSAHLSSYLNL